VCLKCLARDPAQRYGGAKALAEELERWLAGEPLTVRPASAARLAWQWLRKHWRAAAWVVLLGVGWGATTAAAVVLILLRTGFFVHYFYQSFPNVPRPTVIQAGEAFGLIGSSRDEGKAAGILGLALISVGSLVVGPLVARTIRAVDWRGDLAAGGATALVASIVAFCLAVGPACACLAVGNVEKDLELLAYGYATHGPRAAGQLIHPQEEIVRRYPDLQAVPEEYRGLQLRSKIHGDLWAACFHGLWWGLVSTVVVFLPFGLIQTALAGQVRRRGSGWKVAWAESLDLGLAGLIAGLVGASFITGGIQQGLAIGVGQLVIALVLVTGFQFVPLVLPVLLFSYRWRWWQRWLAYSAFLLFPIGGWVFRSLTR
jgi:hypothetical protein